MNGNTLYEMSQYMQNFTPEDLAYLPKHLVIAIKVIGKLAPIFYQADNRTDEEFEAIIAPQMKDQLMDISGGKGKPRLYNPASARVSKLRDKYRDAFIFSCIIEHDPNKKVMKKVLRPKKAANEPDVYDEIACYGEAEALAVIFTGRGQVGMGHKIEDAAGFEDYRIKAITGAKARAAADLGFSTADVLKEDDAAIADAPIDPKLAILMGAQTPSNGHTNGVKPVAPTRETAPIQGSVAVTTRATVEAQPKINVQAIRSEIAALREPLTQPERFQITQYLAFKGIPIIMEEWKQAEYPVALQAMKDWLVPADEAKPTKVQVESINGYANTMSRTHLTQTCVRICGVKSSKELNTTRMGYLIGVLGKGIMVYELTNQIDPEFSMLRNTKNVFQVESPFDLLYADRTEEQGTWEDYCRALYALTHSAKPSEPFLTKYAKEYPAWLAQYQ